VAAALWMGLAVLDVDSNEASDGATSGVHLAVAGHDCVRFPWGVFLITPGIYEKEVLHRSNFEVSHGCERDAMALSALMRKIDPTCDSFGEQHAKFRAAARELLESPAVRAMITKVAVALTITPRLPQAFVYALWEQIARDFQMGNEPLEN
jgi:hypothetical protein